MCDCVCARSRNSDTVAAVCLYVNVGNDCFQYSASVQWQWQYWSEWSSEVSAASACRQQLADGYRSVTSTALMIS